MSSADGSVDGQASSDARRHDGGGGDSGASDASSRADAGGDSRTGASDAHDASRSDADAGLSDAGGDAPPSTRIVTSPQALTPSFSPDVHDYYVRCGAGTNSVLVTMTAATGSTIAMAQPTATAPASASTATVDVLESQAIVVDVAAGASADEYWIRCLPHDFPHLAMQVFPEAGAPAPGYYLLGNIIMSEGESGYAFALDIHGVPVWYHPTMNGHGAVDVENVIPGVISYIGDIALTLGNFDGEYELHAIEAGTTTYAYPSGAPVDLHELRYLSNGDYLVMSAPVQTGVNLTGLDSYGPDADIVGCNIDEVAPSGKIVWSWTGTDHLDPVQDTTFPETEGVAGATAIDVFHCNSVDVDPDGNLLVSARQMDTVFLVSRQTGAILWKMGGRRYNKDGAPFITVVGDPLGVFHREHDARFLPNGNISMFDDETALSAPARGVIYSVDLDAGTASMVWQFKGNAQSVVMGSFRVADDGSGLIGWGIPTGNDPDMTEVDVNGHVLMTFAFDDGTRSYRAIKIPLDAFPLDVLRASVSALVVHDAG